MKNERVRMIAFFFIGMLFFYLLGVFVALDFNIAHWDGRGRLVYGIFAPLVSIWIMSIVAD